MTPFVAIVGGLRPGAGGQAAASGDSLRQQAGPQRRRRARSTAAFLSQPRRGAFLPPCGAPATIEGAALPRHSQHSDGTGSAGVPPVRRPRQTRKLTRRLHSFRFAEEILGG